MKEEIKNINLSVVLPAYNDESTIKNVVDSLIDNIKPAVNWLEVIIVEDGSPDKTAAICDELSKSHHNVSVIHHEKNMGYGATLRDGFNAAVGNLVFYTDGDNQYSIKELLAALNIFKESNINAIIGFRRSRKDGLIRIIISKIYNLLFKILFFINVRDVNCSFKLIKKDVIKDLSLNSKSAFIDAEIIWKLRKKRCKIKEMAITHLPNDFRRTNFINPRLIWEMVYEMFKKRLLP